MGNIAAVASIIWGCAVQLMAAVSIGSGMTFAPTNAQLLYAPRPLALHAASLTARCTHSGVYAALLVLDGIVASTATRVLARLQGVYATLNILYVSPSFQWQRCIPDGALQAGRRPHHRHPCRDTKGVQEPGELRPRRVL